MTFLCCEPATASENLKRIHDILDRVNRDGVTQEELDQAKNKVASRVVLRSERPMGRLSSLGGNWVYRREYRSVEDDLNTLKAITLNDIRQVLDTYPLGARTTSTVGPLEELAVS